MNKYCGKCGSILNHPHAHTDGGGIINEVCSNEECRDTLVTFAPNMMGGEPGSMRTTLDKKEWEKLFPILKVKFK